MYHSIIIEESLKNKKVFEKYNILKSRFGGGWHMHIVEVSNPEEFIKTIQNAMTTKKPYYFHIYNDKNYLTVVFRDKVFYLDSSDESTFVEAQEYGARKLNIPEEQLDFKPNNFNDEEVWYNK